jgi:hypothetical protein
MRTSLVFSKLTTYFCSVEVFHFSGKRRIQTYLEIKKLKEILSIFYVDRKIVEII